MEFSLNVLQVMSFKYSLLQQQLIIHMRVVVLQVAELFNLVDESAMRFKRPWMFYNQEVILSSASAEILTLERTFVYLKDLNMTGALKGNFYDMSGPCPT